MVSSAGAAIVNENDLYVYAFYHSLYQTMISDFNFIHVILN